VKVIVLGATGMVGQGVLRECLLDDEVESVLVVGRTTLGTSNPRLREIVHRDFCDFSAITRNSPTTTRASSASASPQQA
jgi:hypothetical protein